MFRRPTSPGNAQTLAERIRKASEHRIPEPLPLQPSKHAKRSPRNPTFRNATLTLPSGKMTVVVTNVSDAGARIEFASKVVLNGDAVLDAPMLNVKRNVVVTWQREGCAGLRFAD